MKTMAENLRFAEDSVRFFKIIFCPRCLAISDSELGYASRVIISAYR